MSMYVINVMQRHVESTCGCLSASMLTNDDFERMAMTACTLGCIWEGGVYGYPHEKVTLVKVVRSRTGRGKHVMRTAYMDEVRHKRALAR